MGPERGESSRANRLQRDLALAGGTEECRVCRGGDVDQRTKAAVFVAILAPKRTEIRSAGGWHYHVVRKDGTRPAASGVP